MTVLALLPRRCSQHCQQAQREREIETIFRGEEVAEAIRLYYSYQVTQNATADQALPTSVDQLLKAFLWYKNFEYCVHLSRVILFRIPVSGA